jgi:hypothetical protein
MRSERKGRISIRGKQLQLRSAVRYRGSYLSGSAAPARSSFRGKESSGTLTSQLTDNHTIRRRHTWKEREVLSFSETKHDVTLKLYILL